EARLSSLPANVRWVSLDGYFQPSGNMDGDWQDRWKSLQQQLAREAEFRIAADLGMFQRISKLMNWGLAVENAWTRLFDTENVIACLSADDANPYSSIPLLLARHRGIPSVAVHHGALDYRMALKPLRSDRYLAKGELERDYLLQRCRIPTAKIV